MPPSRISPRRWRSSGIWAVFVFSKRGRREIEAGRLLPLGVCEQTGLAKVLGNGKDAKRGNISNGAAKPGACNPVRTAAGIQRHGTRKRATRFPVCHALFASTRSEEHTSELQSLRHL